MPDTLSDHPDTTLLAAQLAAADGYSGYVPQARVLIGRLPGTVRLTIVEPSAGVPKPSREIKRRNRLSEADRAAFKTRFIVGESPTALAKEYGYCANYPFSQGWHKERAVYRAATAHTNGHAAAAE